MKWLKYICASLLAVTLLSIPAVSYAKAPKISINLNLEHELSSKKKKSSEPKVLYPYPVIREHYYVPQPVPVIREYHIFPCYPAYPFPY